MAGQGPDGTYTTATIPALPASSSAALELHIRGVTFVGVTGWLYIDDTGVGSPAKPLAEPWCGRRPMEDCPGRSWRGPVATATAGAE